MVGNNKMFGWVKVFVDKVCACKDFICFQVLEVEGNFVVKELDLVMENVNDFDKMVVMIQMKCIGECV